jgi:hypothetical protein
MTVPSSLIAGDTWEWTRDLSDYPAGTWTLTYYFTKDGKQFNAVASADGLTHAVSVPAATTATYQAGRYKWQARVSDGADAYTVEGGWVEVSANPATSTADPRTWARRTLEAVECFLEGNASTAQSSMAIQGRSISRWPLPDLMQLRDKLRQEVRTEEQGSAAGLGRNIKVRFGRG